MPFARQIGQRVRARRLAKGWTQKQLGDVLELSYQQVQRYESGVDNISASRLQQVMIALEAKPGSFFADEDSEETNFNGVVTVDELKMLVSRPDAIRLLRAFANVCGKNRRLQVIEFVEYASRHTTSWPSRYKQVGVE